MKEIRIWFTDLPDGYSPGNNFIYSVLSQAYNIILDKDNPDYLFYTCFGKDNLKYNRSVRIYFTGENDVPDFNLCDYAIASPPLSFGDRYFQLPYCVLSKGFKGLYDKKIDTMQLAASLSRKKFCNFVYSNKVAAHPIREAFFNKLSQYKPVDSGGQYMNNIGGPVADKQAFIGGYKFTIAFENSALPGYTTEKLVDPMVAGSMPVYWGNPLVGEDFNTKSFILVKDEQDIDRAIQEIISLDNDNQAYIDKMIQPWMINDRYKDWQSSLLYFLNHIVRQPLITAPRTTSLGYMYYYRHRQRIGDTLYHIPLLKSILKRMIR